MSFKIKNRPVFVFFTSHAISKKVSHLIIITENASNEQNSKNSLTMVHTQSIQNPKSGAKAKFRPFFFVPLSVYMHRLLLFFSLTTGGIQYFPTRVDNSHSTTRAHDVKAPKELVRIYRELLSRTRTACTERTCSTAL